MQSLWYIFEKPKNLNSIWKKSEVNGSKIYFQGLTLVMAPHLARSYHHLFPLDPFIEKKNENNDQATNENKALYEYAYFFDNCWMCKILFFFYLIIKRNCAGCQHPISMEKTVFQCGTCKNIYCIECDIFIHETLHSCPSCTNPIN